MENQLSWKLLYIYIYVLYERDKTTNINF